MIPVTFSTDPWMSKVYKKNKYNCFDFTRDVWLAITGEDIKARLEILRTEIPDRRALASDLRAFKKLRTPEEPCIVMMRSPRVVPHIGVYLRRRILHLSEEYGTLFQRPQFATMNFKKIAYYK